MVGCNGWPWGCRGSFNLMGDNYMAKEDIMRDLNVDTSPHFEVMSKERFLWRFGDGKL